MTLQTLVAALKQNTAELPEKMNLDSDAIIINQCDENRFEETEFRGNSIKIYSLAERGVGLSRNTALLRSSADIVLFSDEDIVYEDGYRKAILDEFDNRPDADILIFNIEVIPERRTYWTEAETKIKWYNCGRYPAYSFACRRDKLISKNITYSLLFGGGARYSNGEDSLFIQECIKKGLKVFALPVTIGREVARPSTWFNGYNEKYFTDRGVLYGYMYGMFARPMAYRFLLRREKKAFENISFHDAWKLMMKGLKESKDR